MKDSVVSISKEVMGGTPVFAGTRVPIQTLIDFLTAGDTIHEFIDGFPTVSREQVIEYLEQSEAQMLPMITTTEPAISIDREIMSGVPVFTGTRVPVSALLENLEVGVSLDEFLENFPTVSRQQAVSVLEHFRASLNDISLAA